MYPGHRKARDLPAAWTSLPYVRGRHEVRSYPPGTLQQLPIAISKDQRNSVSQLAHEGRGTKSNRVLFPQSICYRISTHIKSDGDGVSD